MRLATLLTACLLPAGLSPTSASAVDTQIPQAAMDTAAQLRQQALADGTAWSVVESLTTEIGPRLPGSDADARAVEWAQAKLRELGYDRVWTEPVSFPTWERRSEHAQVLGAHAQPLLVTALGGSPGGTVEAQVVRFDSIDALRAAPDGSLAGRIAFVDQSMERARDGSNYGKAGAVRSRGPSEAIRKGAVAFLMRSLGTSRHRVANTGITRYDEGLEPIPSAALSLPDADQLARLLVIGSRILPGVARIEQAVVHAFNMFWNRQIQAGQVFGLHAAQSPALHCCDHRARSRDAEAGTHTVWSACPSRVDQVHLTVKLLYALDQQVCINARRSGKERCTEADRES